MPVLNLGISSLRRTTRHGVRCWWAALFIAVGLSVVGYSQQPLGPDHPEVRKMIDKGVKFLTVLHENTIQNSGKGPESEKMHRVGYEMLTAYAILKATEDHDHAMVRAIVPKAIKLAYLLDRHDKSVINSEAIVYEASVAAMFLSSVDPEKYKESLEQLCNFLLAAQKPSGGFGYLHGPLAGTQGDVSQTQYVALALWSLKIAKVNFNPTVADKMARWLMSSQNQDGGWSYQVGRVQSDENQSTRSTPTMLAAGLSATLIGADIVGALRKGSGSPDAASDEDDTVPGAFRRVTKESAGKKQLQSSIQSDQLQRSIGAGTAWLSRQKSIETAWYYYWLYSRERYESFIELFTGRREESPAWYRDGVNEIKKMQDPSGAWGLIGRPQTGGAEVATDFAILFLLRNTQKAIGEMKSGDSIGGYGLSNVADVGVKDGKLIDKSQVSSVEDALKLLESDASGGPEDRMLADRVVLSSEPARKKEELARFARMLRNPDTRARRIAAKILGRGDDLDYAPDLIFALSLGEKDNTVVRLAENSLRILSRQLDTYKLPKEGEISTKDRVVAEQYWKAWYLSIRPDYVFVNE
jgi:hypothetical protein